MENTYKIIVAISNDFVIGKDGKIPWDNREDLQYFKKVTMNHPIIMGRKTYESIGRALPGRVNIVLTRNKDYTLEDKSILIINSVDDIPMYDTDVFIIGGSEIYKIFQPMVTEMYITRMNLEIDDIFADRFHIIEDEWDKVKLFTTKTLAPYTSSNDSPITSWNYILKKKLPL